MSRTEVIEAIRGMSQDERDSIIAELQGEPAEESLEDLDFLKFINDPNRPQMEIVLSEEDIRIIEERSAAKGRERPMEEFIEDLRTGKFQI